MKDFEVFFFFFWHDLGLVLSNESLESCPAELTE